MFVACTISTGAVLPKEKQDFFSGLMNDRNTLSEFLSLVHLTQDGRLVVVPDGQVEIEVKKDSLICTEPVLSAPRPQELIALSKLRLSLFH